MVVNCSDVVWVVFPTADRTAENEKTVTCTGMTLCLVEQISAFANERGSGGFPESCCGIFGDQRCVETDENDTKSLDDRPSGDIIESTDHMGRRNTIYLGNIGLYHSDRKPHSNVQHRRIIAWNRMTPPSHSASARIDLSP